MPRFILKMSCPDRVGVVASIAQGLLEIGANIVGNSEFQEPTTNTFCMRSVFEAESDSAAEIAESLTGRVNELGATFGVRRDDQPRRSLVMASKYDHCLLDLFYRRNHGELKLEIPLVVSNHEDLRSIVEYHGTEFYFIPVDEEGKQHAEQQLQKLVDEYEIDFVVLARYMQILSTEFCEKNAGQILNIHHSFLPGFKGANPYQQAWDRGVKIIGATAHYVTPGLDEGPIIAQGVTDVSHRYSVDALKHAGRDLERMVLSKAVKAHAEDRTFLLGDKTVVFD